MAERRSETSYRNFKGLDQAENWYDPAGALPEPGNLAIVALAALILESPARIRLCSNAGSNFSCSPKRKDEVNDA